MDPIKTDRENIYAIRIKEAFGHTTADWFNGIILIIPQKNDGTLLVSRFTDQSALRGFLDQLWNLNYSITSIEQIANDIQPACLTQDERRKI